MQLSLVLTTFLCLTTWLNFVQATHGPASNCSCVTLSNTRPHPDKIVDYKIQKEGACRISAVKFRTVRGIWLCSKPDSSWTKRVIEKVDAKRKALSEKTQTKGSASDIIQAPGTSTISTNAPTQKGTDRTVTTEVEKTQNKEGLASAMTPAASTTSTNTTPKESRLDRDYRRKHV